MGFTDKKQKESLDSSQKGVEAGNPKVSFDTIINLYEGNNNLALKEKASILKDLKNTLDSKNLNDVNDLLGKLYMAGTTDLDAINGHLNSLKIIAEKYNQEKQGVFRETQQKSGQLEKDLQALENIGKKFDQIIKIFEKGGMNLKGKARTLQEYKKFTEVKDIKEVEPVLDSLINDGGKNLPLINKNIQLLSKVYTQKIDLKNDKETRNNVLIQTQFLTDLDSIFTEGLKTKIEKSEKLTLKEILSESKKIKIESENLSKDDWNNFFDDLRDGVEEKDLPEFEKMVKAFHQSDLYKKASGKKEGFKKSEKTGYEGVIENGKNIALEGYDYIKSIGGLDIEGIGSEYDNRIEEIFTLPDSHTGNIGVEIGGVTYQFKTKEEAIRSIYKAKLILSEISKDSGFLKSFGLLSTILTLESIPVSGVVSLTKNAFEVGLTTGILGTLLSTTIMAGVVGVHIVAIGGPIESIMRNIQDVLATRLGDKGWSAGLKTAGSKVKSLDLLIKNNKVPGVGRVFKLLRYISTGPLSTVLNFGGAILEKGEKATIESLLKSEKINVVDGLFEPTGKEVSSKQEMQQRIKILDFYKKKWKYDSERLAKLDQLVNPSKLVVGGQLNSLTETFYIKLHEIDKGQIILTNKGDGKIDRIGRVAKGAGMQILHVFSFPNYKESEFAKVNKSMEQQREALKVLFSIKDGPNGQFEIGNKTEFCLIIEGLIDLDGTLSNEEELKRNKLFNEYIDELKNLEIQDITPERVKQDLVLISEGYLPKYKILETLKKAFDRTPNTNIKARIQKAMDKVYDGKWIGTESELKELINNINDLTKSDYISDKEELRDQKYIDDKKTQGTKLLLLRFSLDSEGIRSEKEFIKYFEKEIKINQMLRGLDSNENIEIELKKLYLEIKGGNINGVELVKNDFTKGHINYIVEKILSGESYDNAKKPFSGHPEFQKVNMDYGDLSNFSKSQREELLKKMKEEFDKIEKETDKFKKEELIKKFQKRFDIDSDLEKFIKNNGTKEYEVILEKLKKEVKSVDIYLKDFVTIQENTIVGEGKDLLEVAKKIDNSKQIQLKELEGKILISDGKIKISQLENIIKSILSGDLSIREIRNINFDDYKNDSKMTSKAKEVEIVEPKEVLIYDSTIGEEIKIDVVYTQNSEFTKILNIWKAFVQQYDRILELKEAKISLEKMETSLSDINKEINVASGVIISNQPKGDIKDLKIKKESLEKSISKMEDRIKGINLASELKFKSVAELDSILNNREVNFKTELLKNPGFKEFIARNPNIDINLESAKGLWEMFRDHFSKNVVKELKNTKTENAKTQEENAKIQEETTKLLTWDKQILDENTKLLTWDKQILDENAKTLEEIKDMKANKKIEYLLNKYGKLTSIPIKVIDGDIDVSNYISEMTNIRVGAEEMDKKMGDLKDLDTSLKLRILELEEKKGKANQEAKEKIIEEREKARKNK